MADNTHRSRVYEAVIADLESEHELCEVFCDHRVRGCESGIPRQVDVWVKAFVGGLRHEINIAIECKLYSPENKIGIEHVDAFCGFLQDVGADKGALVTTSSFTKGARARADGRRIETKIITFDEALVFRWSDFIFKGRCATFSGCAGTISWAYHEKPSESAYGFCNNCGSFHIRCGFCEEYDSYPESDRYIRCNNDDCRGIFLIQYDDGTITGVTADLMDEENES